MKIAEQSLKVKATTTTTAAAAGTHFTLRCPCQHFFYDAMLSEFFSTFFYCLLYSLLYTLFCVVYLNCFPFFIFSCIKLGWSGGGGRWKHKRIFFLLHKRLKCVHQIEERPAVLRSFMKKSKFKWWLQGEKISKIFFPHIFFKKGWISTWVHSIK